MYRALYHTELLHDSMIITMKGIKCLTPETCQKEMVGLRHFAGKEAGVVFFPFFLILLL